VLEAEIAAARREAKGGPRPPALAGVERLVRSRRGQLYAALVGDGAELVALAAQVKRVAEALEARMRAPASGGRAAADRAPAARPGPSRAAVPPAATTH
jgi:hypothetical protein